MNNYKQPYLQKYKTKDDRYDCPGCGKKKCFTLYLSGETNKPINSKVGICNHENSCGYHYTPKQYFIDNPQGIKKDTTPIQQNRPVIPVQPIGVVPFDLVEKSASYKSNFVRFLFDIFDYFSPESPTIVRLVEMYAIGATKAKEVIFWQIDTVGKVRTGKIMQYNPETGKRIEVYKDFSIDWVHKKLIRNKQLPEAFNLQQCFFGEHLLKLKPDATVAVVESEKSAIIAAGLMPEFIWIAAGNINGLSIEKCSVLKGRNVILFPDLKAFDKWSEKATEIKKTYKIKIDVSDILETIATDDERESGLDIADYLIAEMKLKTKTVEIQSRFSQPLQEMININPALLILIDKLELEEIIN